jgi:hypothetical protein
LKASASHSHSLQSTYVSKSNSMPNHRQLWQCWNCLALWDECTLANLLCFSQLMFCCVAAILDYFNQSPFSVHTKF